MCYKNTLKISSCLGSLKEISVKGAAAAPSSIFRFTFKVNDDLRKAKYQLVFPFSVTYCLTFTL